MENKKSSSDVLSPLKLTKIRSEEESVAYQTSNLGSSSPARNPILNDRTSKNYHRFKYYSALKTGYKHLGNQGEYLEIPHHVIDANMFVRRFLEGNFKGFNSLDESDGKHGSVSLILSIWNAMIGSVVVTLPWAYS